MSPCGICKKAKQAIHSGRAMPGARHRVTFVCAVCDGMGTETIESLKLRPEDLPEQ